MRPRFRNETELEDLIDRWHDEDDDTVPNIPLHTYLGLTAGEYALYVESPVAFWRQREADETIAGLSGRRAGDERLPDPEPELQHQDGCGFAVEPCTCSRAHLIGESYRLRERLQLAERQRGETGLLAAAARRYLDTTRLLSGLDQPDIAEARRILEQFAGEP
jgi:hypothetical protein